MLDDGGHDDIHECMTEQLAAGLLLLLLLLVLRCGCAAW